MFLEKIPPLNHWLALPKKEAHHLTRVLRLGDGDEVLLLDGEGLCAKAVLKRKGDFLGAETRAFISIDSESQIVPITLEMAILKPDAMSWVIEKATELGATRLIPIEAQFSRKEASLSRWQRIADEALKQCGRLKKLEIPPPVPLADHLALSLPAGHLRLWCNEQSSPNTDIWTKLSTPMPTAFHLLIGPEGGWSEEEHQLLQRSPDTRGISLGPLILRAETAALYSLSVLSAQVRGMNG